MEAGVDEKMANKFAEGAIPMWIEYRMQLAERNAKAEITKEEMEMINNLVKSNGLSKESVEILQKKLFNYKRFFSETEIAKELTEEERETFMAMMEELGAPIDEKMMEKIGMQWIDYKMRLLKTMG
jgi:hypothetical protein